MEPVLGLKSLKSLGGPTHLSTLLIRHFPLPSALLQLFPYHMQSPTHHLGPCTIC